MMKKLCLGLLSLAFVCSCSASTPIKREPVKAPPNLEQEFKNAEALAKKGDAQKAIPRLKRFVEEHPDTDLTGHAYFYLAQLYQQAQKYKEALENYIAILNMPVVSSYEAEAGLSAARLQLRLGLSTEADKTLERTGHIKSLSLDQGFELEKLRLDSAMNQSQYLRALNSLVVLAEQFPNLDEREQYRRRAIETVDTRLNENDLRTVADDRRYSFLQGRAKYRYGVLMAEQRQYSTARDYLLGAIALAPESDASERAQKIIAQIDARHRVDQRTIGVILPLSGKQSSIGYKALRGIQLGLGIFGHSSSFRLAVIDSEGNPDTARRAVERLVQEDNAIGIIGGLLGKTAGAEAAKAQEFGIPMILLTQKSGATRAGDYIFRNALTSQMQVQMLVETAMDRMGLKNFAILFPNDAYGVEFTDLFWDEVRARGGQINGAQSYDPQETDFRGHVQRLVGTYYLDDRIDEYRLLAKAWRDKNPRRSARQSSPRPDELLSPIIDFDAIFIPDSARAVGQIAPMLAYTNVTGVKLIGTNIWNSQALINRGQKFVEGAIFADSFLANDSSFLNSNFYKGFVSTFDEEPGLTEIQSFDAAQMIRQELSSGASTRSSLRDRLARVRSFAGALGPLSVNSEREFMRPLSALTIKDGRITPLDRTGQN